MHNTPVQPSSRPARRLTGNVHTMKCKKCGKRYSADLYQPAPGGSSSPGVFLILAVLLLAGSATLFIFNISVFKWILLGLGIFVMIQVPIAWSDCRGNGGYATHGGVDCPACNETNTVYPWSL